MILMIRFFPRSEVKVCAILGAAALALGIALTAGSAIAQSTIQGQPNALQGFSQNRDQPIQIEAASLEMRDKKKEATFSGNVKVIQGDTTMTSKTLVVFYESGGGDKPATPQPAAKGAKGAPMQSATPGPGGSSSIKRLEARGNVVVTQKDQVVTGETAVFDTKTNLITMFGGGAGQVVMTQCKNVMRGDRLTVDMTTGVSRVESDSGRGVQVLLPQGAGSDCGSGAPAKPGAAPPSVLPGVGKK
ncbi:lipopolysaccharide export system protein LptA [Bradyrhizobium arachidis]|uniref:LPS ABC transporter substrate-binding protein LptA n=2 Tax=Bradyrhizobium arachidis TaxID=858423 RepID=A0AAE7NF27_9BRAD|nr:LPS ABC transporter substrate-binding protein LptA [Bradyrhizobium arachidis]SFU31038.1 lipopolysaccharide export system protein LptA [Bradyrhizobium arachidis]